jgi:hypothetical protein
MSILKRLTGAAPLVFALLLAGCGGGATIESQAAHSAQNGVDPGPQTVDTAPFIKLAQADAACADLRNRLWLIDGKEVFWDRAGSKCPDNNWSQRLYGTTPQAVLCSANDSVGGPQKTCANDTVRALFDTITKAGQSANLGLDASHKVEAIGFQSPVAFDLWFGTIVKQATSGIREARNVVVKDQASWEALWRAHTANLNSEISVPQVDFSRQMVVAVFAGNARVPCGQVGIVHVGPADGKLVVEYEERTPAADVACVAVVTEPAHIVLTDRSDAPVEFVAHKVELKLAQDLDSTQYSRIHVARNVVVKDQQAWAALWAEHAGPDRAPPVVDFSRKMVVGVFNGELLSPCYRLRIDSVSSDASKITVRYVLVPPPFAVMCIQSVASMAQIIAIDRSELPVEFTKDTALNLPGM